MEPKTLELVVEAAPANVACIRRRVGRAASAAGVADDVVEDVRLCVTEACANAVAHAYGATGGVMRVEAAVEHDEFVVVVSDAGVGIGPCTSKSSGYGLRLIRKLAPRSSIVSASAGGTEVRMRFPRAPDVRGLR